jgi:hypothetical protein
MKNMNRWLVMLGIAGAISMGSNTLNAQDTSAGGNGGAGNGNNNANGGRQRRQGGQGNFDPAQFQQRMMDNYKERLEITDDTEWKAIEPLIQKVMDARRDQFMGMGRGMFGGGRNRGGDNQGDQGGQRRGAFPGATPSPEAEMLTKAIESKASTTDLKAAMAKFVEARKAKQAELETAQANLRKVLTVRQEAIATESGLL